MATFKYFGTTGGGQNVSGFMEAFDEFEAVDRLRQESIIVNKITPAEEKKAGKDLFAGGKISEKSLAIVCSQFAIIISSGLPIVRAVELIAAQTGDKALKKILLQVADDVAAGHSLAHSFESKGKKQLPVTFIETIRAGEEAGTLDKSFARLHTYYEKSSKVKSKVTSALAYPIFLIVVAIIVVIIIMTVAVPVLSSTFAEFGSELPLPTRILISVSNFLSAGWMYIVGAIVAIVIFLRVWSGTEKGRVALAKFKLKLPIVGKIGLMKCASQFAGTMSTMLAAGLPMVKAVGITGKVLSNYHLGLQVSAGVSWLETGRQLGEYMKKNTKFPELLTEMTSVGEETGNIENTLDVVGDFFDNEVETASARALSLLEPAIIIVLAIIVVFILLAVYMAMFSMYSSM